MTLSSAPQVGPSQSWSGLYKGLWASGCLLGPMVPNPVQDFNPQGGALCPLDFPSLLQSGASSSAAPEGDGTTLPPRAGSQGFLTGAGKLTWTVSMTTEKVWSWQS